MEDMGGCSTRYLGHTVRNVPETSLISNMSDGAYLTLNWHNESLSRVFKETLTGFSTLMGDGIDQSV